VNFPGLETHWERLAWPVEGPRLESGVCGWTEWSVQERERPRLDAPPRLHGPFEIKTQRLNTIPTIFLIIGKNPYRRDLNTVPAASADRPKAGRTSIAMVEANESIFLDYQSSCPCTTSGTRCAKSPGKRTSVSR
jgi:hypothetical protein